jgi:hypothetical protein
MASPFKDIEQLQELQHRSLYIGHVKQAKKILVTNLAIYIMNTKKKTGCKFSFTSTIDLFWSYLSQNMGLFQPRQVKIQTKKR